MDGTQEGLLAVKEITAEVRASTLHKLAGKLGAKLPGVNGGHGTARSVARGDPLSRNGLTESGLVVPEDLKPELRRDGRAFIHGGEEERDVVGPDPGDSLQ